MLLQNHQFMSVVYNSGLFLSICFGHFHLITFLYHLITNSRPALRGIHSGPSGLSQWHTSVVIWVVAGRQGKAPPFAPVPAHFWRANNKTAGNPKREPGFFNLIFQTPKASLIGSAFAGRPFHPLLADGCSSVAMRTNSCMARVTYLFFL